MFANKLNILIFFHLIGNLYFGTHFTLTLALVKVNLAYEKRLG
jgi:hypothetical protein